ncbi:hypothetical protein F5148DRAFT_1199650 [Russula earlei]|uniref:Uncharacterized protein n=1 Tax=Russula earlei TaxID=71964 RepID=A0ACC0U927_9AGAM|nr:hypothetical protein F5148DRAFT_1199650 [Russula earlei]
METSRIAVWHRNKIVSAVVLGTWVAFVGTLIHDIVKVRGAWSTVTNTCIVPNSTASKLNLIIALCNDIFLLVVILIGLVRWRLDEGGGSSLIRFLWNQGLLWLLLVIIAYVPTVVFISLNLNAPWNMMFQTPALVTVSIAATRMYRTLSDYGSRDVTVSHPKRSAPTSQATNGIWASPISLDPMEVAVRTDSEQYSSSRPTYESFVVGDQKLHDKPRGLGDVESGM